MQQVPSSAITHASVNPPLIPDGRISRVRSAAMAFPRRPFPFYPKLKRSPAYASWLNGLIFSSTSSEVGTATRPSIVRTVFPFNARHLPRAALPVQGVTSYGAISMDRVRGHYPSFIAHTSSCARPKSFSCLGFTLVHQILAGCCEPLLEVGPSRRYLCRSFSRCLAPYPGAILCCSCPFLHSELRPSPV